MRAVSSLNDDKSQKAEEIEQTPKAVIDFVNLQDNLAAECGAQTINNLKFGSSKFLLEPTKLLGTATKQNDQSIDEEKATIRSQDQSWSKASNKDKGHIESYHERKEIKLNNLNLTEDGLSSGFSDNSSLSSKSSKDDQRIPGIKQVKLDTSDNDSANQENNDGNDEDEMKTPNQRRDLKSELKKALTIQTRKS